MMVSADLLFILFLGVLLMIGMIALQMKWYTIEKWKSIVISLALVITGVIGSEIWYFVENGFFGGRSFYGSIFFAPIVFFPVAKALKISYLDALDFCAPAGCLTLALVKIQCLRDHCCQGMVLYVDDHHMYVRFPSQIVEFLVFLFLSALLSYMASKPKNRKSIFPQFLLFYGTARFLLNFLRETTLFALGMSAGSFWSLIAAAVGGIWLIIHKNCKKEEAAIP